MQLKLWESKMALPRQGGVALSQAAAEAVSDRCGELPRAITSRGKFRG